jgi:phosphonate transport system ATP-binding protein
MNAQRDAGTVASVTIARIPTSTLIPISAPSVPSLSPPVTLEAVSKSFGGRRALDRVSVHLRPGELVAVVGRSGAGKTTFLRCLARAVAIDEGTIRFGGEDVAGLAGRALRAHRARIGMIYQQFNLVKRLRVADNVLVGRLPHATGWRRAASLIRWFPRSEREVALRCLDHVGLLDRVWQRTDTLSGGEQQRVAIAKILAQEPRIVLGDEPVASLDVANGSLVMDTLRRIASDTGVTVITTLHHVDYARRYADRILGFRRGRLVFDGPPDELGDAALEMIFGDAAAPSAPPAAVPTGAPEWATP